MQDYTNKLMTLRGGEQRSALPSAIFGSASTLQQNLDNRERIRIGLWPIISEDSPKLAMGLATVLASLLERSRDVRVYRLFLQLNGKPEDYTWTAEKSQFEVEDWELDGLDENAAVWGTLAKSADGYTLTIELEDDLIEDADEENTTIIRTTTTLSDLVNTVPEIADEIMATVGAREPFLPPYTSTQAHDDTLTRVLEAAFDWQVNVLLDLWGKAWPSADSGKALNRLIDVAQAANDEFSPWVMSNVFAHTLLPGYSNLHEVILINQENITAPFTHYPLVNIRMAQGLFNANQARAAYDILEQTTGKHPEDTTSWLVLGELYRQGGRLLDAVDAFQRGLEAEATSKLFYVRYVDLLFALATNDLTLDAFVLIDPDDYPANELVAQEAIAGYEAALEIDPEDMELLRRQILQVIAVRDEEYLWDQLETLVDLDTTGEAVRSVVDTLYIIDDLQPAIDILESAIKKHPKRADLLINLAVVLITDEQEDAAIDMLEKAEDLTDDDIALNDIDRLYLIADDPEFEARIGEITALVNAGSRISSSDLDYLEEIIEEAPGLTEIHVLLGKAYLAMSQGQAALETLLDGHEQSPEDPELIVVLAQILWESNQKELAFDYLNKGVATNPNYVALLTLTGQYLFEADQPDNARAYLARAEAISPKHPSLIRTRKLISEMLSKRDS